VIKERAQRVLSVLRANAAKARGLDLGGLKDTFNELDWKPFRDRAKEAVEAIGHMRRDPSAERRNGMMFAAVGAVIGAALMYLFDPQNGSARRPSVRERVQGWYQSARGRVERERRGPHFDPQPFDLAENADADGQVLDTPADASGQEATALSAP
jgi:hypothetical protein